MRSESGQIVTIGFFEEKVETGRRHHVPAEHGQCWCKYGHEEVSRSIKKQVVEGSWRQAVRERSVQASRVRSYFWKRQQSAKDAICHSELLQALLRIVGVQRHLMEDPCAVLFQMERG